MSHPTVASLLEETTADSPGYSEMWQIKIFVYFGVSVQPISLRTLVITNRMVTIAWFQSLEWSTLSVIVNRSKLISLVFVINL